MKSKLLYETGPCQAYKKQDFDHVLDIVHRVNSTPSR